MPGSSITPAGDLRPVGLDPLDGGAWAVSSVIVWAFSLMDVAVDLLQQVAEVGRHEVNHLQFQRVGCGHL